MPNLSQTHRPPSESDWLDGTWEAIRLLSLWASFDNTLMLFFGQILQKEMHFDERGSSPLKAQKPDMPK